VLSGADGLRAACTLAPGAMSISTVIWPASKALIAQRLALAEQAFRQRGEQNLCSLPPELRGVNGRLHHRQR
jgi:hypothetical protein